MKGFLADWLENTIEAVEVVVIALLVVAIPIALLLAAYTLLGGDILISTCVVAIIPGAGLLKTLGNRATKEKT